MFDNEYSGLLPEYSFPFQFEIFFVLFQYTLGQLQIFRFQTFILDKYHIVLNHKLCNTVLALNMDMNRFMFPRVEKESKTKQIQYRRHILFV